jgi:hypothetical protein
MGNKLRLTESDLHRVIKESVKKVLKEGVISQETFEIIDTACNNLETEQILNYFCLEIGEYQVCEILKRLLKNNDIEITDYSTNYEYEFDGED